MHLSLRASALALLIAATASADTPPSPGAPSAAAAAPTPSVHAQLRLAVAQVTANEAGFRSLRDADLIWQATARFRTDEAKLAWLRSHSCRVLGQEYCLRPRPCPEGRNCQWAQHLTWSDEPPLNWPADTVFPAHSWRRLREHVQELVRGRGVRACAGTPVTWGGEMDEARAARLGYVALDCGATRNTGYGRLGSP